MTRPIYQPRHISRWRGALFGRGPEQKVLRECMRDMLTGTGSLVILSGEAGIGKTSLVRSLLAEAEGEGAAVLSSACYDLTVTPPYGPWLEFFSGLRFDDTTPPLPVASDQNETQRAAGPDRLFPEALDYLVDASARQPLVLALEDLQWCDAASLEFLRYVARQIADAPIMLIATYRSTELDRRHPLQQLLPVLVNEAHATRISLGPLSTEAVRALVKDHYTLPTADETRLVRYLQRRAEGNPFFIGEILRTLEEKRHIELTDSGWSLADLTQIPVPPLVRQLIEGRLDRLDDRCRHLLRVASVTGQDVSLDVWQVAGSATEDDLSATIRQAIELHLMEETAGPASLRFTHALVREALYYELDLPQRRALHRTVGEALAERPSPEPNAVAYHLREARHEQAPEWLMAAGERAQQLYAWRSAAERFESVLPLLGSNPTHAEARGWLLYRIGLLLMYADSNRGISRLGEAERIANEVGDQHLAAYARADRGLLRCLVGDVRRGLSEMRAGIATLETLPALDLGAPQTSANAPHSVLSIENIQRRAFEFVGTSAGMNIRLGALTFWLAWAGRYADAIETGESYVSQASDSDAWVQDSIGDALAGLGHAYAALGRPNEALDAFARARETYQSIDHHFKVGNTAIYELSEAYLPYRADHVMERQWLAEQAEAG